MKKTRNRFFRLLVATITVVLVTQISLFVASVRTRQRSELLLMSLRKLQLKVSTLEDTKPLLLRYNAKSIPAGSGCASADVSYGILVSNRMIDYLGTAHPFLLELGFRPVSAVATLSFLEGRLCEFSYTTSVLIGRGQYPTNGDVVSSVNLIELNAQTAIQEYDSDPELSAGHYSIHYFNTLLRGERWPGRSLGMRVTVTPDASPLQFQHALTFDLSCLTSLRGCHAFCQMMPLASQDALEKHKSEGTAFPENEISYPGCNLSN